MAARPQHSGTSAGRSHSRRTIVSIPYVAYVNGDDRTKSESRVFVERGEPEVPFDMPVVVQGVDISFFAKQVMAQAPARFREETSEFHIDPNAANENLKRRP